jgi:hypothetical protein
MKKKPKADEQLILFLDAIQRTYTDPTDTQAEETVQGFYSFEEDTKKLFDAMEATDRSLAELETTARKIKKRHERR